MCKSTVDASTQECISCQGKRKDGKGGEGGKGAKSEGKEKRRREGR